MKRKRQACRHVAKQQPCERERENINVLSSIIEGCQNPTSKARYCLPATMNFVHVCVFVCVYLFVWIYALVYTQVLRPQVSICSLVKLLIPYFQRQVHSLNMRLTNSARSAGWPVSCRLCLPVSASPALGLEICTAVTGFLHGCLGSELRFSHLQLKPITYLAISLGSKSCLNQIAGCSTTDVGWGCQWQY